MQQAIIRIDITGGESMGKKEVKTKIVKKSILHILRIYEYNNMEYNRM